MKRNIIRCLLTAATAAVLASCLPKIDYLYTDTGMCTVLSPTKLQTDNGEIYFITQNNSGGSISDTVKRVMIQCDVLSAVEGKTNEYNILLQDFAPAMVQHPVNMSTMDEAVIGNDGLNVSQAWVSGGYLNSYVYITILNPSEADHSINLVYDDVKSNSDTLYFEMRHNAHGESPENPDIPLNKFVFAGTYLSLPLDGILGEGQHPVCHLEWDWYDGDDNSFYRDKIRRSGNITVL